ncbi:MAG: ABC transporter permease [Anaerolineaceae bacterium]|jgi:ABC-2 type transport system permease protein|nr:ABC transporter permease [Anaerolineaceae bacterium]MDD4042859.1 ABC transporter permease [Anaerolineaceae bacterium]MDD4577646.1 ABC transporter permease [Anaerolineaceae bacterium]
MTKFFNIIKKDIKLYFSSPVTLIFFIVLPILFTSILAAATGAFGGGAIVLNYVDQAQSPLSASLLETLQEDDTFELQAVELAEAQDVFAEGRMDAYLLIPPDFDRETMLEGDLVVQLYQQPNRTTSQTIFQELQLALTKLTSVQAKIDTVLQAYQELHPEVSAAELDNLAEQLLPEIQLEVASAPARLTETVSQSGEEIVYDPAISSSAGQLITWVFMTLLGVAGSMAFERERGTLKRLLVTPTSRLTYFSATIFGTVLIALVQIALLMVFGALVWKAPWLERPLPTALLMLAFSFASAGLGAFMGSLVRTESQAGGIGTTVGMTFALLSGAWFPIELFPKVMQNVAKIFPTYWGMQGLKDILISNKPFEQIVPTIGILLGFAVVFLALGMIFFKTE